MGRMPGTTADSMPAAPQRSRNLKNESTSKKNCVMARVAPASNLRFRLSRSLAAHLASGCVSGYAATETSKSPTRLRPATRSDA